MSNVISCSSCGASNQLPEGKISMFCAFCGSAIQMKAEQNNTIPKPEENPQIKNYLELAKNAENSSNFDEAINYYNKALEYNPKLSEAWFGKGYCAGWSGNLRYIRVNEMVINFKKALDYASNQEQDSLKDQIVGAIDGCAFVVYKLSYDHTVEFARVDNTYQEHLERSMEILFALEYAHSLDPTSIHILDSLIKISENLLTPISYKDYDDKSQSLSMENHSRAKVNDIRIKYSTLLALANPKYASELEKKVQFGNILFYIGLGGIVLALIFYFADNIIYAIIGGMFSLTAGIVGFKTKSDYEGILKNVYTIKPQSTASNTSKIADAIEHIKNISIRNAVQKSKKIAIISIIIVCVILYIILINTDLFKNTSQTQIERDTHDTAARVDEMAKSDNEKGNQNYVTRDLSSDNNARVNEENQDDTQNTESTESEESQGDIATNETENTQALFSYFTDARDGHRYKTVRIGNQVWMAENLKYLPSVVGAATGSHTSPYYYVYGYDGTNVNDAKATDNYKTYGVLYNWPAAMAGASSSTSNPSGIQGVCPSGWHLPSDAEWTLLTDYLGGASVAGGKLKQMGTSHWASPNAGATNNYGFTALPGGNRIDLGECSNFGSFGLWWSATERSAPRAWLHSMTYYGSNVAKSDYSKEFGFSVRCMRD